VSQSSSSSPSSSSSSSAYVGKGGRRSRPRSGGQHRR
jgi:hypothetical protein